MPLLRAWRPSDLLCRRLPPFSLLLGQSDQSGVFFGEHFVDDQAGRGVDARIGGLAVPLFELGVEIVQVPKGPIQEEALADATERALQLAIGLRPIGFADPRH